MAPAHASASSYYVITPVADQRVYVGVDNVIQFQVTKVGNPTQNETVNFLSSQPSGSSTATVLAPTSTVVTPTTTTISVTVRGNSYTDPAFNISAVIAAPHVSTPATVLMDYVNTFVQIDHNGGATTWRRGKNTTSVSQGAISRSFGLGFTFRFFASTSIQSPPTSQDPPGRLANAVATLGGQYTNLNLFPSYTSTSANTYPSQQHFIPNNASYPNGSYTFTVTIGRDTYTFNGISVVN